MSHPVQSDLILRPLTYPERHGWAGAEDHEQGCALIANIEVKDWPEQLTIAEPIRIVTLIVDKIGVSLHGVDSGFVKTIESNTYEDHIKFAYKIMGGAPVTPSQLHDLGFEDVNWVHGTFPWQTRKFKARLAISLTVELDDVEVEAASEEDVTNQIMGGDDIWDGILAQVRSELKGVVETPNSSALREIVNESHTYVKSVSLID